MSKMRCKLILVSISKSLRLPRMLTNLQEDETMSRHIITDLVLPIVVRELNKQGANIPSYSEIQDNQLLDYLEHELMMNFSICGSKDHCKNLEEAIKEYRARDEASFVEYIKFLLNKYINLKIKLAGVQKIDPLKLTAQQAIKLVIGEDGKSNSSPEWRAFNKTTESPPDRFSEFRKRNRRDPIQKWLPEE